MSNLICWEDQLLCSCCWNSAKCWLSLKVFSLVTCSLWFRQWHLHSIDVRLCKFYSGVACERHSQVHLVCSWGKAKSPVERCNLGGLSMSISETEGVMWDDTVLFSHSTAVCLNTCPTSTHKYLWEVLLLANSIAILLANANLLFLLSLRSADTWLMYSFNFSVYTRKFKNILN